jgi:leucyl aminopeptidase (aminopeptidase T)
MDEPLVAAAETAVSQCLALQPDESLVVVTDDATASVGEALYEAGRAVTDDASVVRYPPRDQHAEEPPAPVAAAMCEADAFLAPTATSLSHTRARKAACEAGARGSTLPGITETVFTTGLAADYGTIAEECARVHERVADANEVRVTSPQGTDVTFTIGDRAWLRDTGLVHEPGAFSNLPAGEVFVSPVDANGRFVVDGTVGPHGLLDGETVTVDVENGYVTAIDDPAVRAEFEAAAEQVGRDAYNLAELGIGTNPAVTELAGSVLLDEKAAGTVHIAVGDDASIGGDTEAPIHSDGVLRDPTVRVDGAEVELPQVERR